MSTSRWRAGGNGNIAWREWDGELVAFVGHRSTTHLLGAAGGAVLLTLLEAQAALSLGELHQRLYFDAAELAGPDSLADLDTMLIEFERLGLVESETS